MTDTATVANTSQTSAATSWPRVNRATYFRTIAATAKLGMTTGHMTRKMNAVPTRRAPSRSPGGAQLGSPPLPGGGQEIIIFIYLNHVTCLEVHFIDAESEA